MGRSSKSTSQRSKSKKNRGGERLKEWAILRTCRDYNIVLNKSKEQSSGDKLTVQTEVIEVDNSQASSSRHISPSTSKSLDICDRHCGNGEMSPFNESNFIDSEQYLFEDLPEPDANNVSGVDNLADSFHLPIIEPLTGRRIVDIKFLFDEILRVSSHGPFGCTFGNMTFLGEIKQGLRAGFKFKCEMCKYEDVVWSEEKNSNKLDINTCAVAGTVSIGSGFAGLQELLGAMDIRCISGPTYDRYQAKVSNGWQKSALEEMKAAAEEEAGLAKERGDVDIEGTPLLTVVADASWAKRSYGTNYNSMSGVAAIVGYYTRKVLFIGVKNKYCTPCARAEQKKEPAKPHVCYKNWDHSSSAMEAAIIGEGFRSSERMYGVKYAWLIADGDSSVYTHLLEHRPYPNLTVQKTECKNHLLRNYCNKIRDLAKNSFMHVDEKGQTCSTINERKKIGSAVTRLRAAVSKAVEHRKAEQQPTHAKIMNLKKDILNGPSHVFGEHAKCLERNYFCKGPKEGELNIVPVLKKIGLYSKLMVAVGYLVDNARSLLEDVNSNYAEHFNSIVAKYVGGKRINFTQKGSYQARCDAAVVSYNSGTPHYKLHKALCDNSPGVYSKSYELRKKEKSTKKAQQRLTTIQPRSRKRMIFGTSRPDPDYGETARKPDLDEDEFEFKKSLFLQNLNKSEDERKEIEEETRMQAESQKWREQRRNLLTASNFGAVCKRLPHTPCGKLVNRLLYSKEIDADTVKYGKQYEAVAIEELRSNGMQIIECGLFIDKSLPYLAATPDGLIDLDGTVEIKCPSSASTMTPDEAIKQKKGKFSSFWKMSPNGNLQINKQHEYFYQIQGQLHITERDYSNFVIWTPKGMKITKIERDDKFFADQMEKKLTAFYINCLLPELVDPRKVRSMAIREPHHILEAIRKKEEKKPKKKE